MEICGNYMIPSNIQMLVYLRLERGFVWWSPCRRTPWFIWCWVGWREAWWVWISWLIWWWVGWWGGWFWVGPCRWLGWLVGWAWTQTGILLGTQFFLARWKHMWCFEHMTFDLNLICLSDLMFQQFLWYLISASLEHAPWTRSWSWMHWDQSRSWFHQLGLGRMWAVDGIPSRHGCPISNSGFEIDMCSISYIFPIAYSRIYHTLAP